MLANQGCPDCLIVLIGLHGGGCKVPNNVLNGLLEELGGTNLVQDEQFVAGMILPRLGKVATTNIFGFTIATLFGSKINTAVTLCLLHYVHCIKLDFAKLKICFL